MDRVKEKVERYVADLVGPYEVNDSGAIHFRWGSTHVFLECMTYGDEWSVVFISVPVLYDLQPSGELYEYVALHADDWHFGHLSLTRNKGDDRVKLWMTHSLLGDYLDVEELKAAVAGIGKAADGLDDELKARFGGDRHHED
jgi:hypothetical protein